MGKYWVTVGVAAWHFCAWAATCRVVSTAAEKTGVWSDAYVNDIQSAIAAAGAGGTVLLKPGTYAVSSGLKTTANGQTVKSDDGSGNTDRAATVLDGTGLSGEALFSSSGNRVVTLEGLTFRNARGGNDYGGAVNLTQCGASVLKDCAFHGNAAKNGGAIALNECCGRVEGCAFYDNAAEQTSAKACGGAAYVQQWHVSADNYVTFTNCTFATNVAASATGATGGAIYAMHNVLVDDCRFETNDCVSVNETRGGQLCVGADATVRNCRFAGCVYALYGAVLNSGANLLCEKCTFDNVQVTGGRGNCYGLLHPSSVTVVRDCTVKNCAGGTFVFAEGNENLNIRNCLVYGGSTALLHGHNLKAGHVDHCTFADNKVSAMAYSWNYSNTYVSNSIIMGSVNPGGEKDVVTFANTHLSQTWGVDETACTYGSDPGFRSPAHGDYHLAADSVCLDAGAALSWTAAATDCAGMARTAGNMPDSGCFERQENESDPDYRVRVVATAAEKTGDWKDAHTDIDSAVAAALDGDTLLLKAGTYVRTSPVRITDRALTLTCDGDVIWDAQGAGRCLIARIGAAGPGSMTFEGITFRNGFSGFDYSDENFKAYGGGVYLRCDRSDARITLRKCTVENCRTVYDYSRDFDMTLAYGGGVYAQAQCTLDNCIVRGCAATNGQGGGVCLACDQNTRTARDSGPIMTGCVLSNNVSAGCSHWDGLGPAGSGGLRTVKACIVENCDFIGNTTVATNAKQNAWFGGLYADVGTHVTACRFTGNTATNYGGSIGFGDNCVFSNCTVTAGSAQYGAVYGTKNSSLFTHCTFTNNLSCVYATITGSPVFRNCLFANPGQTVFNVTQGGQVLRAENCTFVGNGIVVFMGGYNQSASRAALVNCLFHDNASDFYRSPDNTSETTFALTNCCAALFPAEHAVLANCLETDDARFRDAAKRNWRLRTGSPCREAGMALGWTAAGTDLDGMPRTVSRLGKTLSADATALPDIGCYEIQEPSPGTALRIR